MKRLQFDSNPEHSSGLTTFFDCFYISQPGFFLMVKVSVFQQLRFYELAEEVVKNILTTNQIVSQSKTFSDFGQDIEFPMFSFNISKYMALKGKGKCYYL